MNIFSLLTACLFTLIACDLLWKKFIKRFWYPDKQYVIISHLYKIPVNSGFFRFVGNSEAMKILFEYAEKDETKNVEKKELPIAEDDLYKFFLRHERRRLRVNKQFIHAPICRIESLFARTYPNEYGLPPPLRIVSQLPNKLLK